MKNKLFVFVFILLVILAVTFCLALGIGFKNITILKLAHGLNTEHPVHKSMEYLADLVEEKSEGQMIIQIFPSEQLGDEKECIESLQLGYLAMTKTSTAPMESFIPKIKIFGIPYLFRDSEHYWKVLTGPIGKELLEAGTSRGLKGLCYFDAGARSFYSKKAINSPKDLKGMKIRVMKSIMSIEMIEYMGGSPTPISWGELYTALDQGVVDAAENNPPSFYTSNHYQICKYYSLDEHVRVPDMLVISTKVWQNLTNQQQRILEQAISETVTLNRKLWEEAVQESLEKVQSSGVKIIKPEKKPFKEAVRPMWEKYMDSEIGPLIQQIQEIE